MPPQNPFNQQNQQNPNVRPITRAPAEPLESTPYDFIMNPSVMPPKKSLGRPGGSKLAYIAGGGILLIVAVFAALSFAGGSSNSPALIRIAQQQAEIARVAALNYSDINSSSVKSFVISAQLTATSEQTEYLQYLAKNGAKIGAKQIALGMNSKTDTAFEAAKSSGALDTTIESTLQEQLHQYQQTIQSAYGTTENPNTKALLKNFYDETTVLLEQSKS